MNNSDKYALCTVYRGNKWVVSIIGDRLAIEAVLKARPHELNISRTDLKLISTYNTLEDAYKMFKLFKSMSGAPKYEFIINQVS